MPSFMRTAAVAAFAAFASAQTFSNSTAPSPVSFPGWQYAGCFDVSALGTSFLYETSPFMTVERCLLDCSNYAFARLSGSSCFCAGDLSGLTRTGEASCFSRCPGNGNEACGGVSGTAKRQAVGTAASVYQQVTVAEGDVYVTVINNVYIDFCPSCNNGGGGLTTVTYYSTATLTGCGCTNTPKPTIPVTTTAYVCPISGTTTTVTLTVPTGVVPGTCTGASVTAPVTTVVACSSCPGGSSTSTVSQCPGCKASTVVPVGPAVTATPVVTSPKTVYTGAAVAAKAGSGLLAGVVAVAAFL